MAMVKQIFKAACFATVVAGARVDEEQQPQAQAAQVQQQQVPVQAQLQAAVQAQMPVQAQLSAQNKHAADRAKKVTELATLRQNRIMYDRQSAEAAIQANALEDKHTKAAESAVIASNVKVMALGHAFKLGEVAKAAKATVDGLVAPLAAAEAAALKAVEINRKASTKTREAKATHEVHALSLMDATLSSGEATKRSELNSKYAAQKRAELATAKAELDVEMKKASSLQRKSAHAAERAKVTTAEEVVATRQAAEATAEKDAAYKALDTTEERAKKAVNDEEIAAYAATASQSKAQEAVQAAHQSTAVAFTALYGADKAKDDLEEEEEKVNGSAVVQQQAGGEQ